MPSVDQLLQRLNGEYPHATLVEACRLALENARVIIKTVGKVPSEDEIIREVQVYLVQQAQLSLRAVINATGVIVHTNLGRAPLSDDALQVMHEVAQGYSTLEYDLDRGDRGKRDTHIENLITQITAAEAALVVNNNAAAVYLALMGLALGKEVILSRGELVEIGGGFRMPDVMAQSGCDLVEVGTTNRTRLQDFAKAITPNTALLLRVHASNFKIIGFTESVPLADLAALAHEHGIHLMDDLGSGALLDTAAYGLAHEPTIQESLKANVDLVTFSGDKLLGGPQAGILVGKKVLIDRLKKHPLARALRPDKLCLAGLAVTLRHYRDNDVLQKVPVWRMISMPISEIEARAYAWQTLVGGEVISSESTVGGGSLPGATLPTKALALKSPNPDVIAGALRQQRLPIIARIQNAQLLFDPRTVFPDQDQLLLNAIQQVQAISLG